MTNQPLSENNAKFSSSFVFGPGDVAYISHPNINNCISWFMMIHYRTAHILCWFNSRNNNRKIMNWVSWSVGCLVLCGENRAGTGRRWTFNTEQTQSASAAAKKNRATRPGFPHSLADCSLSVWTHNTHWPPYITIHDLPINVSFPSQERFDKLTH